jgi:hypothetical protein
MKAIRDEDSDEEISVIKRVFKSIFYVSNFYEIFLKKKLVTKVLSMNQRPKYVQQLK